jgi:hypothetical protein
MGENVNVKTVRDLRQTNLQGSVDLRSDLAIRTGFSET